MMPTNPNMVKCIEVLITQKVDPNFKTLVSINYKVFNTLLYVLHFVI